MQCRVSSDCTMSMCFAAVVAVTAIVASQLPTAAAGPATTDFYGKCQLDDYHCCDDACVLNCVGALGVSPDIAVLVEANVTAAQCPQANYTYVAVTISPGNTANFHGGYFYHVKADSASVIDAGRYAGVQWLTTLGPSASLTVNGSAGVINISESATTLVVRGNVSVVIDTGGTSAVPSSMTITGEVQLFTTSGHHILQGNGTIVLYDLVGGAVSYGTTVAPSIPSGMVVMGMQGYGNFTVADIVGLVMTIGGPATVLISSSVAFVEIMSYDNIITVTPNGSALTVQDMGYSPSLRIDGNVGYLFSTGGGYTIAGTGTVDLYEQVDGVLNAPPPSFQLVGLQCSGNIRVLAVFTQPIFVLDSALITVNGSVALLIVDSTDVIIGVGLTGIVSELVADVGCYVVVFNILGIAQNNGGVTFVSSGGSVGNLTQRQGTLLVDARASVNTLAGCGNVTVAGTVNTIDVQCATTTAVIYGVLKTLLANSYDVDVRVTGLVNASSSIGGSSVFAGSGLVLSHKQNGGIVNVSSSARVTTMAGSGVFLIAGSVGTLTVAAGQSSISTTGALHTLIIQSSAQATINASTLAPSTISIDVQAGATVPLCALGRNMSAIASLSGLVQESSSASGTLAVTLRSGGTLNRHNLTGGIMSVNNSGSGTIGMLSGYGTFDIVAGPVAAISTSDSGNSTITVQSGASVNSIVIGGSNTAIIIHDGGIISEIMIAPVSSNASVTISISGTLRAFNVTRPVASLIIVVTAAVQLPCVDLGAAAVAEFVFTCSSVHVLGSSCAFLTLGSAVTNATVIVDNSTFVLSHPLMVVSRNSSSSPAATLTSRWARSTVTVVGSDVFQLAASTTATATLNVTSSNITILQAGSFLAVNSTEVNRSDTQRTTVTIANTLVDSRGGGPIVTSSAALTLLASDGQWTVRDNGTGSTAAVMALMGARRTSHTVVMTSVQCAFVWAEGGGSSATYASVVELGGSSNIVNGTYSMTNVSLSAFRGNATEVSLTASNRVAANLSFVRISGSVTLATTFVQVAGCTTPPAAVFDGHVKVIHASGGGVNITDTTLTVQSPAVHGMIMGRVATFANFTAVVVDSNISRPFGSVVSNVTVLLQCLDATVASVSLIDVGSICINSTLRVELVAIRQVSGDGYPNIALIRLGSSTGLSTGNRVHILRSSLKVSTIISSGTGSGAFSDSGIVLQCSFVGSAPLTASSLDVLLQPKVSNQLPECPTARHATVGSGAESTCWSTLSASPSTTPLRTPPGAVLTNTATPTPLRRRGTQTPKRTRRVSNSPSSSRTSLSAQQPRSVTSAQPGAVLTNTATRTPLGRGTPTRVPTRSVSNSPSSSHTASLSTSLSQSRSVVMSRSIVPSVTPKAPPAPLSKTNVLSKSRSLSASASVLASASEARCECSGDIASHLLLAATTGALDDYSIASTLNTLTLSASASPLTATPLGRLAIGASHGLVSSLALRNVPQSAGGGDNIETVCWQPSAASLRGQPIGLRTLANSSGNGTSSVTWTVVISPANDNVTLSAWLPPSAGPYEDASLPVTVTFLCNVGASRSRPSIPMGDVVHRSITLVVPVAAPAQQLAAEVRTVSRSSQFAAAVASGAGGASAGRAMATRAVVLCSSGEGAATAASGPLGILVGNTWCGDLGTSMPIYRGTIVGNVILLAAVTVVVGAFALGLMWARGEISVRGALRRVAFPSCLQPVWIVILPSTATATAQMMVASDGECAGDVICMIIGLVMTVAPVASLGWLAYWAPAHPVAVKLSVHSPAAASDRNGGWVFLNVARRRILHRSWVWAVDQPSTVTEAAQPVGKEHSLRHCMVVLQDYRNLPYATVDIALLAVVGLLVSVSGHGGEQQCLTAGVLVAVAYAVQLLMCIVLRPFTTLLGDVYAAFTLLFALLGAVIQLSMFTVASGNSSLMDRLSLAASVCDLISVGTSLVRTLIDVYDLLRVVAAMLRRRPNAASAEHEMMQLDASSEFVPEKRLLSDKASSVHGHMEDVELDEDIGEHLFWDVGGMAIGLQPTSEVHPRDASPTRETNDGGGEQVMSLLNAIDVNRWAPESRYFALGAPDL